MQGAGGRGCKPTNVGRVGRIREVHGGLASLLFLFDLGQRFAVDAEFGSWSRFKPLYANFDSACIAKPVVVLLDTLDGLVNFSNELALSVSRSQLEAELFLLCCAICGIRKIRRFVFHVRYRAVDFVHKIRAPVQQDLFKMRELGFAHVLFAFFGGIGRKVFKISVSARSHGSIPPSAIKNSSLPPFWAGTAEAPSERAEKLPDKSRMG
jgi:hypothetical protein